MVDELYSAAQILTARKMYRAGATPEEIHAAIGATVSFRTFRGHLIKRGMRFTVSTHLGTSKASQPGYIDPGGKHKTRQQGAEA